LVVVNLVGVEKIGDCSLKNVPILRRKKTGRKKKALIPLPGGSGWFGKKRRF